MIKKFAQFYKPHKKLFVLDFCCACFIALLDLSVPLAIKEMITKILPKGDFNLIIMIGVVLFVIYTLRMICQYIVEYYGHALGVRIEFDLREKLFSHIQTLPIPFFNDNKVGKLMTHVVSDLNEMSEIAHHGPEDLFTAVISIVGSAIMMCRMSIELTLIMLCVLPFVGFIGLKLNALNLKGFKVMRAKLADINAQVEDNLSGIRVVKAFTNEDFERGKFEKGNSNFRNAKTHTYKTMAFASAVVNFFSNFVIIILFVAGGYLIFNEYLSAPDLLIYFIYLQMFVSPIQKISGLMVEYNKAAAGFSKYLEIMEIPSQENYNPNSWHFTDVEGKIEFKNVSFAYESKDNKTVLNNINLLIESGSTVALCGPSGSGKSTLCNLIPRFFEITAGEILIDDHNIHDADLYSLRKQIGIVAQDVYIFSGSIYENILYGRPDATREEVIEAAKRANAHEFILETENGYDTNIGERGVKISGGQKQRISIARVFLKNPPILILDEATSALDNKTEKIIQTTLNELSVNRTTLIIAHRLSTIEHADKIVVLTEDGIAETGSHEELMANKKEYYRLQKAAI